MLLDLSDSVSSTSIPTLYVGIFKSCRPDREDMGDESTLLADFKEKTPLSDREAETLVYMGEELERTDTAEEAKQIVADGLGISPNTVDTYYRRALVKLKEAIETIQLTEENLDSVSESL